jgi:putative phosphoribosyl transferase
MGTQFKNRRDAGRFLATQLERYARQPEVVVLALPRGGVPVGFEIARHIHASLDIFIVRKLGVPIHEELAMGAIASGGVRVLNEKVIRELGITPPMIDAVAAEQRQELHRREKEYRGDRKPVEIKDRTIILVDDGLATGASMRAAVLALKQNNPKRIIVAVPVGAPETCRQFEAEVDEVICGIKPADLRSVGSWYEDFTQTTDEEVRYLLAHAAHEQKLNRVLGKNPDHYRELVTSSS